MTRSIVITGLTAAGKTTAASELARVLDLQVLHVTELLFGALGMDPADAYRSPWLSRLREIESYRDDRPAVEDFVDRVLLDAVAEGQVVIDSWALPWYSSSADLLRIWLESDRYSRGVKCKHSHRLEVDMALPDAVRLIDEKDDLTCSRLGAKYGFSVPRPIHPAIDVIVDISRQVYGAAGEDFDGAIAELQECLRPIVSSWLADDNAGLSRSLLLNSAERVSISVNPQSRRLVKRVSL